MAAGLTPEKVAVPQNYSEMIQFCGKMANKSYETKSYEVPDEVKYVQTEKECTRETSCVQNYIMRNY